MSKSRHTEAQIIAALKRVEAGRTAEDVAREYGVPSTRSTPGRPSTTASK
ncbi:transposase [Acidicapsa acidisoli]|nr:transposase [Acidicapsa acidisoli]